MDRTTRDILKSTLEVAKRLESKISDLQCQKKKIENLLKSGYGFEIFLKREEIIFHTGLSEFYPFQPSDLKKVLEVLLHVVSKRLLEIKNQYRQL